MNLPLFGLNYLGILNQQEPNRRWGLGAILQKGLLFNTFEYFRYVKTYVCISTQYMFSTNETKKHEH